VRDLKVREWLEAFELIGKEAQVEASRLWGTSKACKELGIGAGGDRTVLIDKVLEDGLVRRLKAIGNVRLLSEETGEKVFGQPKETVIADPLDGSFNAKMGIPIFAISLALIEKGDELGDMSVGYIRNLVNGDVYHAIKGHGAFFNGEPIETSTNKEIQVLGMESHPNTVLALEQHLALVKKDTRIRSLGCISLDLCHVARGIFDALVDVRERMTRIVDIAAGKVLVEEAGGRISDERGKSIDGTKIEMENRLNFIASANKDIHEQVLKTLLENDYIH